MPQIGKLVNLIKNQKGYIMALVMVTVVILATVITTVSVLALADVRQTRLWQDQTEAFYLAESGIDAVVAQLVDQGYEPDAYQTGNYPAGTPITTELGVGKRFQVWVAVLADGKTVEITSLGISNKVKKVVHQELYYSDELKKNRGKHLGWLKNGKHLGNPSDTPQGWSYGVWWEE